MISITFQLLKRHHTSLPPAQQPQQQPHYSSVCICLEIVGFLVKNAADSRPKIQSIFRALQRGLTACLTSTEARVVASMSTLIQSLVPLMPADFFNAHPASAPAVDSLVNPLDSSSDASGSNQPQTDPIYLFFGQPDGIHFSNFIRATHFLSVWYGASFLSSSQKDPIHEHCTKYLRAL